MSIFAYVRPTCIQHASYKTENRLSYLMYLWSAYSGLCRPLGQARSSHDKHRVELLWWEIFITCIGSRSRLVPLSWWTIVRDMRHIMHALPHGASRLYGETLQA